MIGPVLLALLAFPALQPTVSADAAHALVEGVATDGRVVWLSSVLDRNILVCRNRCRTLAVLPPDQHPLGIVWDRSRRLLWVTSDCPALPQVASCDKGMLLALDRRGTIRIRLQPASASFHPGDVSATRAGTFVSDSQNGAVYRVEGSGLSPIVPPGTGKSAQGSALANDGKTLIVADYSQGIASVDLATHERTLIDDVNSRPLRGIDGLIRCRNSFYAVHNGSAPPSLIRFTISRGALHWEELVSGRPLSDPTQLASDGKRLLMVANSGWDSIGKRRSEPASIVAVSLGSCRD
jgi:hypothetical protein